MGRATAALDLDKVKWTFFRVPWLGTGEAQEVKAGYLGSGSDGMFLNRKSMAVWVLNEAVENKWVGEAPMLNH